MENCVVFVWISLQNVYMVEGSMGNTYGLVFVCPFCESSQKYPTAIKLLGNIGSNFVAVRTVDDISGTVWLQMSLLFSLKSILWAKPTPKRQAHASSFSIGLTIGALLLYSRKHQPKHEQCTDDDNSGFYYTRVNVLTKELCLVIMKLRKTYE